MSRNTMTRAHFQLIAETIREEREAIQRTLRLPSLTRTEKTKYQAQDKECADLAARFAGKLRSTNSGFKADRFLDACDPAVEYRPKRKMGNQNSGYMTSSEISAYKKTRPDLYGEDLGTESGCNDD